MQPLGTTTQEPWTAERIAERLTALAAKHETPNRFQFSEIADSTSRKDVAAVIRACKVQMQSVNEFLFAANLHAEYQLGHARREPDTMFVDQSQLS